VVSSSNNIIDKAPSLNGKILLPLKAILVGLGQHKVAAVYAILQNYTNNERDGVEGSSSDGGWEKVVHIGITKDLSTELTTYIKQKNSNTNNMKDGGGVPSSQKQQQQQYHVRALSFSYPQKSIMEEIANTWRSKVQESKKTSSSSSSTIAAAITVGVEKNSDNEDDDDEDDEDMDDDELDDYLQMMAGARAAVSSSTTSSTTLSPPLFVDQSSVTTIAAAAAAAAAAAKNNVIISPFEGSSSSNNSGISTTTTSVLNTNEELPLELTIENVDQVLNEVRPYLISDGGNVSVQRIDNDNNDNDNKESTTKRNVYLILEGACGSCASSTVTMKMGIERVLREKFGTVLGDVVQVDPNDNDNDDEDGNSGNSKTLKQKAKELTIDAVQAEVDRMSGAIVAMGGVVRIVNVDPIGVVTIDYRGPNRVKRGLELALLDVEYVKHVNFVS
jgi:Fe-S cluster biogenesis protein NfuA